LILAGERSPICGGAGALIDLAGRARRLQFVTSIELLLTLVASGKGAGLIGAGLARTIHRHDLAFRPLRTRRPKVTTLLLRRNDDESPLITRFVERAQRVSLPL
jgi:DNA-binding transcriptional LysR family regulator